MLRDLNPEGEPVGALRRTLLPPGSSITLRWDDAVEIAACLLLTNEILQQVNDQDWSEIDVDILTLGASRQADAVRLLPLEVISAAMSDTGKIITKYVP
jgi:hypothetical protein